MATFLLEIKTPDKLLFSGEVESMIVQHPSGKEGYMAYHEPIIKEIAEGIVQYRFSGESQHQELTVSGGFLSFDNNRAILFIR